MKFDCGPMLCVALLLLLVTSAQCFSPSFPLRPSFYSKSFAALSKHSLKSTVPIMSDTGASTNNPAAPPLVEYWYSPLYSQVQLKSWFLVAKRPLLRVGGKGIAESHINSLNEMLDHHGLVRVKVSSKKRGPHELSGQFMKSSIIRKDAKLLMITQREMLFGIPDVYERIEHPY
jgi:RNA-binding protein YhbY